MKLIIELSENDYKALKEDGVQNHLALAYKVIAHSVPYEERPKGDWIINPDTRTMKCSRCGAIENADRWLVEDMNYCHCCGADMRGDKNE